MEILVNFILVCIGIITLGLMLNAFGGSKSIRKMGRQIASKGWEYLLMPIKTFLFIIIAVIVILVVLLISEHTGNWYWFPITLVVFLLIRWYIKALIEANKH